MSDVRVGCAGWSYRDWVGPFYPPRMSPSQWLESYAGIFPLVEVDSTFYAVPARATVEGWLERTRRFPAFRFSAKVPQDVTHKHLPAGAGDDMRRVLDEFRDRVVEPLEEAGRLEALLVQLPPGFAYYESAGTEDALTALRGLLEALEPRTRRVAVEFRHASWFEHLGEALAPEVADALAGLGVALTKVDGLGFRFAKNRTTDWSYFRLHGRRTHIPPSERGLSHAPYNYLYTPDEVAGLAQAIQQEAAKDQSAIVIFNNHYRAQAPRNAMDLMVAMGLAEPNPLVKPAREAKLDEF